MIESKDNSILLMEILEKEVNLVNSFIAVDNLIMDSIVNNNWDVLEPAIKKTKKLSHSIEKLDKRREVCVDILRKETDSDSDAHFYHLTVNMEEDTGNKVNNLYRDLKLAVLNLQNINWRINTYISTVTGIMKHTLKEIYPNRRGSMYSKTGAIKEAESNPMVLNRKL